MQKLAALVFFALVACGPPVSAPDAAGGVGSKISFEPVADSSAVPSVVRLRVASATLGTGEVGLFQGTLSSYFLARIRSGEIPKTLTAREITIVSWRAEGQLMVAPVRPLLLGDYSLAASSGLLAEFRVAEAAPLLSRLWPPATSNGNLAQVIYCGDGSSALSFDNLTLQPGAISVTPLPGVDESGLFQDRCVHFASSVALAPEQIVVPPVTSGGWALDPAPFSGAALEPATSLACSAEQTPLGNGCASIEDDRVIVRTPAADLLWIVHTTDGASLEITRGGGAFAVRGLFPATRERLWGQVFDVSGARSDFDITVLTSAPRERPVLNEVLANPLGPEPQSEWIELVNDGARELDLSHFSLRDGGGSVPLPKLELGAHEYALLTRTDFAVSASDVPPAAGARFVRVPELGKSGLANGGEPLALLDGNGVVVSRLPPVAAKAGQSLARRHSYSLDDDASAFTTGTPTPGAPNDEPEPW